MILITNRQRKIPVDLNLLKRDAQHLLELLGYENFDLGALITTDQAIRKLNKEYRNKDKATDVLSFAYHPELQAGKRIRVRTSDDANLGDLVIGAAYVARQAQELEVPLAQRMRILLVHGVCHLLGYDHIEDHDWRRMRAKEAYLLKQLAAREPII